MLSILIKNTVLGILLFFSVEVMAETDTSLMTYDLALKAMDASEAYARQEGLECYYFNYRPRGKPCDVAPLRWRL